MDNKRSININISVFNRKAGLLLAILLITGSAAATSQLGNYIISQGHNITTAAGVSIGAYMDGVTCSYDFCIYRPWYTSSYYLKNGTTQEIDATGTDIGVLLGGIQGRIQIQKGTYTMNTQLTTANRVYEVEGEGANETIINAATGLSPFVFNRDATALSGEYHGGYIKGLTINVNGANVHAINVTNSWMFEASGLRITSGANYTSAINISSSYHASIHDNRIINYNGTGVHLDKSSNGAEVFRNDFSPRGVSAASINISGASTGTKIYNNWFEFSGGYGNTHIYLTNASTTKIYGNQIGNPLHGFNAINITGSTHTKIFGNSLYCGEGTCINVTGGTQAGLATRSNDIQNNDIWLESANTSYSVYGVYFNEDSSIISGNNFYVNAKINSAIHVAASQTGVNINGNNIIAGAANSVGVRCLGNCLISSNWLESLALGVDGNGQSQLIDANWFNSVTAKWTNLGASSIKSGNFPDDT